MQYHKSLISFLLGSNIFPGTLKTQFMILL